MTYTFPYNANHTTWANMIVGNSTLSSKDAGQVGTGNRYAALDASGTTSIWLVSGDTSSNSGNAAYTSNPYATPVVSSLSATSGKAGDSLTITGTGLKPQAGSNPSVTIGGVNAAVTSATATSVVVTIPAGLTNNVASAVVVSNAGGTSNSDKTFTIVAVPTISSLNVTSGVRGDVVTITGTGFTGASSVVFGSTSASSYSVVSATSITATVPTGAANGLQNVAVTTLGGTATSTGAFTVNKATPSVTATPSAAAITYGQTLASATLSGGSATVAGSFAYATPTAAPAAGTADESVVFTPSNTTSYNTVTFSVSVTVNKANPTVTSAPSASGITYGQTLADSNLTGGSVSVAGSWSWSDDSVGPNVGSASQNAVFRPTDSDNYNTVERSVSVTTSKATPSIIDAPSAEAITYGQTLASATLSGGSASVDGSFAFATPTAAPVAGTASKSVVFTPSDTSSYNTVSLSVSVTTNKATPDVTWPTASGIRNPAPLSSSTLSGGSASFGSTSVVGSFAWASPTTVPESGTADYSVQFTPSSSNFSTVTGDVSVTSLPAFAGAPTVGAATQTGGTVSADITAASGTTIGSVTVTVDGTVRAYSVSDDTYSVTVTRADAGKSVVFSAIGAEEGKIDSDSVSNDALTVGVATAPTIGTVSQSGLNVSTDITAATGTDLTGVAVTVAGTVREFSVTDDTYTVTLSRSDLGSAVVFSAAASATAGNKLDSAASTSSAFTFSAATAPTSVNASQSGFDVTATIELAANTSTGTVTATVGDASPVVVTAESDGSFVVTLTRADAGKSVVFTATATQDGKAESDSTSSAPVTFQVAAAPTFGTVSQDGLTLSVDVNPGSNQSVGTVSATVDGNDVSVTNTSGATYEVELGRSAIGKSVVFTATATRTGFAESASASTSGTTVLVTASPTFGATTQNELVISVKVNLGGDQTYGTVTAAVDGGEAQETTYEGDGVFSITLTKDEIGKSIAFSATAAQSGRADSDEALSTAYTMLTPAPQLASLSVDYGIRGASITATGNYLSGGSIKVGDVSATVSSTTYTSITFTVPTGATSGEVSVVATTSNGVSSGLTFTVADAPTITGFAAWMGATAPYVTNRGRTFDIFGTNLNNASFTVGGVPVSTVKGGDTVVRVMLPADAALGTGQAVVATTPMGGASNITYIDVIEHLPVITGFGATSVRPGDLLTIYGNWLDNPAKVRFSVGGLISSTVGVDAALTGSDVVLTTTAITVRVPAGAQTGRIRIYTPVGFIQSTDILTVYPAPKITTMKIGSLPVTGAARGKIVSIAGLGFTNASVTIGGVSAQIASNPTPKDTGFNVIVPNGVTPGASTQLIVTSQYGVPSAPLAFTVGYDQPVINSLSVTGGALGSLLTINGKDLTGTSSVKFTANKLANLSDPATVITDTAVTVKVPAGATTGVITLTARGGAVTSSSFTVYQLPTLSAPAPTVGKAGAIISIAGTYLTGATFRIGGVVATPAPSFTATAVSARIVVPAGAALSTAVGDSTVSVTTLGGTASAPFTVVGAPAISDLSSSSAVVGTDITISGSRLLNPTASPAAAAISVKIGGVAAPVKAGATSSQLVVTVPLTAPVGSTTVSVTTLGGTVSTGLTVLPRAPSVSGLNVATQNRGLTVRISGTNLLNATVTIGGVSATITGGATAAALVVTVPENAPLGSQTVLVTTAGGSDSTKLLVVKVQLPRVTAVSQVGTKRGVGTVTVTGSFLAGATVKVGNVTVSASAVNINEAGTSLTFTIPATAVAFSQAVITIATPGGSWASANAGQKIAVTA
ncbi:MAG: IPT/TIG domain-containing protein [Actinobacteria bacterium]|nr:IPT/TIG domain-containing protein [Actinomycetota bacterium]